MADKTKFARLFDLYRRFCAHAQLSVPQMMADYGINRRTANRDINDLKDLGVELEESDGGSGLKIWSLSKKSRTITVGYNPTDLTALFMGRRLFDFLQGTILEESLVKIYDNIAQQMNKEKNYFRPEDLARKVYLVSEGPKKLKKKHVGVLDQVLTALLRENKLEIRYQNYHGRVSDYILLPYTLVAFRRGLYLLGRLDDSDRMLTFALERISRASWIKGNSFSLPQDYDPEKYFRRALLITPGKPEKVEIAFSASSEPFIRIREFHHSQKISKLPDGRIKMTLRVPAGDHDFEIINFVLSFHENAEVLSPTYLRERVKQKLLNTISLYD